MVITIDNAPQKPEAGGAKPGDLKEVAWKKDVLKLLNDALEILKTKADKQVTDVAQSIEMAIKSLQYEEDTTDVDAMLDKARKSPMDMFGQAEDQSAEQE